MEEREIDLLESELSERYESIEQVYKRILDRQATFTDRTQDLDSMAYQLHNLYGAHEQLFEVVVGFFENQIEGARYHTDLLRRMKIEIKGIRPALISRDSHDLLDELRRFRHFFRHAYTAKLDPDKVSKIVQIALQLREPFRRDMEHFLAQLR